LVVVEAKLKFSEPQKTPKTLQNTSKKISKKALKISLRYQKAPKKLRKISEKSPKDLKKIPTNPSKVEVPLPSSSRRTRESRVPRFRTMEVSWSSTMKVLWFSKILSEAPSRVKILSAGVPRNLEAGT
jgi:hypothetical protein